MKTIEAYQTTDGKIFDDEDKAIDHQEGLQASTFLKVINATIPERLRNHLTSNDWYTVQVHVVTELKKNKDIIKAMESFLNTTETN